YTLPVYPPAARRVSIFDRKALFLESFCPTGVAAKLTGLAGDTPLDVVVEVFGVPVAEVVIECLWDFEDGVSRFVVVSCAFEPGWSVLCDEELTDGPWVVAALDPCVDGPCVDGPCVVVVECAVVACVEGWWTCTVPPS